MSTSNKMATNSERSFNEALARVLRTKNPRWLTQLAAEQHRTFKGGGMPDLIIRNPKGAPVVVSPGASERKRRGGLEYGNKAALQPRLPP